VKTVTWKCGAILAMSVSLLLGFSTPAAAKPGGDLAICNQVSAGQLKKLYRKHLYPPASPNHCFWSERPHGMADMDIRVQDARGPLRAYFAKSLPSRVKLVKITDIGNGGLMSVGEGTLGVVVIRKGKRVLLSAVTFLDIRPGSKQQAVLWDIYRKILKQM
jgi:hypothetical protein